MCRSVFLVYSKRRFVAFELFECHIGSDFFGFGDLFGARPGHEALGPLAVVILGGLVTAAVYTLGIVPALYARFGAGAMSDAVTDEDLGISA